MEEIKKKIITELPEATTIDNLYTLGTDNRAKSVKVPIGLLKGNKGDKGDAPYAGTNGNWWVGSTDTGVPTLIAVSQVKGQDTVKAPSLKLFTEEMNLNLKITDLLPSGGSIKEFSVDLNGNIVPSKVNSIWVNDAAFCDVSGVVKEFSVNSADTGYIGLCTLTKNGNIFTVQKQTSVSITRTGVGTYETHLEIKKGEFLGVMASPTNASPKVFSSGQSGYWGAVSSGNSFTHIPAGLICYGFVVEYGGDTIRPEEVSNFKKETILEAHKYTDEKFAKVSTTYEAGHLLYSYDMKGNSSDFINQGWNLDVSGATPTILGLGGKLYVNKQINIETKHQRVITTLNSNSNIGLITVGREDTSYQTMVSVDLANNTINIHEIFVGNTMPTIRKKKVVKFQLKAGRKYLIELYRLPRGHGVRIIDYLTGESDFIEDFSTQEVLGTNAEVYAGGSEFDMFGVCWIDGTAPIVHNLTCGYYGTRKPLLYIAGDSITQGYGTNDIEKIYAHLIGSLTGGDYIVSPRGGGKIGGVIEKIQTECAIIRPKYVMITIGTNETPTITQLQQLVNNINDIGSIPIINCIPCRVNGEQTQANINILSLGVYGCRFDLATCIDPTSEILKADLSIYVDSGHPSVVGHQRMANRARIDLPFLF